MPLPPYNTDELTAAFADLGLVCMLVEGEDMDEAFDDAVTAAYNNPSNPKEFTTADPGDVKQSHDPTSLDLAVKTAVAWGRAEGVERVGAFPILPRGAHTHVTRRAKIEGTAFEVDESAASPWVEPNLDILNEVMAQQAGPEEGEVLEKLIVTRRARYKAVAEPFKGKSGAQFVALIGSKVITKGHPTATAAKKAAMEYIKELGHDTHELFDIEVYKLSGREEGLPLVAVHRERIRQTLGLRLIYAAEKPSNKPPKTTGWLFVLPKEN